MSRERLLLRLLLLCLLLAYLTQSVVKLFVYLLHALVCGFLEAGRHSE